MNLLESISDRMAAANRPLFAITVAAVEHLPEDFAGQKNDFHNLGVTIIQGTQFHHAPHFDQMRAAIQAARI